MRLAQDLERGVTRIMASVYESDPETGTVHCEPVAFRDAVMEIARTARWARGLHEGHVNGATIEALQGSAATASPSPSKEHGA